MSQTKILIVEDEVLVANSIRRQLSTLGYEVAAVAVSGAEAVQASLETCPDLVLMDIWLEGEMDGIEAAARIRAQRDIPVIYLTAHADDATLRRAKATEPFGYILKPFQAQSLHSVITMALYEHERMQRLREQVRIQQIFLDALPCVALLLRPETRQIVAMNRAAREAGCQLGETCFGTWPKFEQPCPWCLAPRLWSTGEAQHLEVDALGVVWDAYWVPISDDLYLHYAFDITARKRADEELQRRNQALAALNAIAAAASRSLELKQVLGAALDEMMHLDMFGAQAAGKVFLLDEHAHTLTLVAHRGDLATCPARRRPLRLDECLCGLAARRGEVIALETPVQDGRHVRCLAGSPAHRDICIPLKAHGRVVGVMGLWVPAGRQVSSDDLRLLTAIGDQVGVAIENARLYEQAQRGAVELLALHKASQAIASTLDLDEVLTLALGEARAMLSAEAASILLLDAAGEDLIFAAASGPGADALVGMCMPATAGVAGRVLQERRPALVEDVRREPRYYNRIAALVNMEVRSLLAAPLEHKGNVLGVIEAINKAGRPFDSHDQGLLSTLAGSIAVAIENVRLFQKEQEQRRLLEQSQISLIRAEKLAAVGRLTASIAHEINNPLQAVQGYVIMAEEKVSRMEGEERLARYLHTASVEIDRIARIVGRMREFYRPEQAGFYPTDLHIVLEEVLELCRKHLEQGHIAVEREWAAGLPLVRANADQLKQVFLNLTLNAMDAMPGGGRLRIRTAVDSPAAVRVEVSDAGVGISPELLPRMFEPFFTTKEKGVGLGLSISYNIIQAHGGEIKVESQVGAGTTFTIWLPVEMEA